MDKANLHSFLQFDLCVKDLHVIVKKIFVRGVQAARRPTILSPDIDKQSYQARRPKNASRPAPSKCQIPISEVNIRKEENPGILFFSPGSIRRVGIPEFLNATLSNL